MGAKESSYGGRSTSTSSSSVHHNNPAANDDVPLIDLGGLRGNPDQRAEVVNDIGNACRRMGFFQVVNHGIRQWIMDEALSVGSSFFELPTEQRMRYKSDDVYSPVRYCSNKMDDDDDVHQQPPMFLKHYAHPLENFIHFWPNSPSTYRVRMGKYSTQVRKVGMELMVAIMESLGLLQNGNYNHLTSNMEEQGVQVMALNCYQPGLAVASSADCSCLVLVLHQKEDHVQFLDPKDQTWKLIPKVKGALHVHIGNHLEVLSNGIYKSMIHTRAVQLDGEISRRVSLSSLHCLGMDQKMATAVELVTKDNPIGYRESSFKDFLDFLAANNNTSDEESTNYFINKLRIFDK